MPTIEITLPTIEITLPTIEITLEQSLLAQLEKLAESLQIPPSEVITLALEELIKRRQNKEITRQSNDAYPQVRDEEELKEEQAWLRFGQRAMLKVVDEW